MQIRSRYSNLHLKDAAAYNNINKKNDMTLDTRCSQTIARFTRWLLLSYLTREARLPKF